MTNDEQKEGTKMTEQTKRDFWKLCDALPEGVHWGDPLTMDIASALFAAYPQEQTKQSGEAVAVVRKNSAGQIYLESAYLDTPGNRHPDFRYAGYKGNPLPEPHTVDQFSAYAEGIKAAATIVPAIPTDAQAALDDYVREIALEAAERVHLETCRKTGDFDRSLSMSDLVAIVNSVIDRTANK